MPETIVLDPVEVSTGRTQFDITAYVRAEGVDWGDGAIEAFMADRERGSAPVDSRVPNRQIVLPLRVLAVGGVTFVQARQNLQRKVGLIQREGGWIKRTTASGSLFADVVNATLRFGGSWMQGRTNAPVDIEAELRLEAIPDWYGAEITLADRVNTTDGSLIWTETNNILGDYPGRLRLVVDEDQGQNQLGLIFGIRARHYSNATTAELRYLPGTMTPLDAAVVQSTAITHSNLSTAWTPVCSTDRSGVALTHTGTYRVWVRASSGSPNPPRLRLVWDVGDFALPTENDAAQLPGFNDNYVVDLGEVRLDRTPSGAHRWRGVIQAQGTSGGEAVTLETVYFVPVDEGYGLLQAPVNVDPGLNPFLARDEFNQSAGVLTGKTLPVGGAWGGAGDTDDFTVEASGRTVQRFAGSDSSTQNGRFALAGTNSHAAVVVQVDFKRGSYASTRNNWTGVIARYVSAGNYVFAGVAGAGNQPFVEGYVSGGSSFSKAGPAMSPTAGSWYTIRFMADTAGRWLMWFFPQGGSPARPILSGGSNSVLATGGQLASGRSGFYDVMTTNLGATGPQDVRNFDNFAVWAPQQDAVLFANQSAEIRTEGMFREDPTGTAFGPVSRVTGDLPRIPPSGAEGRTVQFFLKQSRGDLDTLPDTGIDDVSARVTYRPSYLLVS